MKFENPYVEIQKFDIADIITASGEPGETEAPTTPSDTPSRAGWAMEGQCKGTTWDDGEGDEDCFV